MKTRTQFTLLVVFAVTIMCTAFSEIPTGILKGTVVDARTREPLPGANVLVVSTGRGMTTDGSGRYIIKELPSGTYSIQVRMVGYDAITLTDVVVSPGRPTTINAGLQETLIEGEAVTVTAGYFQKDDVTAMGTVGFNAQEIRRSPGSANDVSRILMALPSTAAVSDNANDLAVRGGSPIENGFYVDGIPIPNINHFPVQGSTGGPIGILNIDFVDNVEFSPSGFSAAYGDRLSSIVDIKLREGNTESPLGKAFLSFAGFGGVAEGPLPSGSGSWMISGNKSYLDLLVGAIGTGVAPRYGDVQGKMTLNLNSQHALTFIDIFGRSTINFDKENAIDLGQRYYGVSTSTQNTAGAAWRALWGNLMTSTTSVSVSTTQFTNTFRKVNSDQVALDADNLEVSAVLRNVNYLVLGKRDRMEFGTDIHLENGNFDYLQAADTNQRGTTDPEYIIRRRISDPKVGLFATYIANPFERLTLSLGMRSDYYELSREFAFAPRLSLSYKATDDLVLHANGGIFHQQAPLIVLSGNELFSKLASSRAYHVGVGLEYMLQPDTRLTLEAYDKEYDRLPLSPSDPNRSVVDDGLFNERFTTYADLKAVGKAYTRGVELMLQKKMAKDIYGLVSASYFRSRYRDFTGTWRNRVYDNRIIFSVIGGYRPGQEWEFSVRWTYAGGRPYTPFDQEASTEYNIGIIDQSQINADRYPAYHALNLRADRKFYFASHLLDIYLSVWNAYNRNNVSSYFWNSTTNTIDTQHQWSLLPIVGIDYEF